MIKFRPVPTTVLAVVLAAAGSLAATSGASRTALSRYYHQTVAWHQCAQGPGDDLGTGLDKAGVRCAEVRVPLDYARPGGRSITLTISRLKATDTAHRIGAMLLNGGGPGGGSIDLPPDFRTLMKDVGPRYDLIGMDPRSSGRSTPVDCGWPTGTFIRSAGLDRTGFDKVVALERDLATRCARTRHGLLPYVSTRNTARDMDVVRGALGERRLSYWGGSYGTYLGAVYTQLFPRAADRVVLDSAVDPRTYGAEDMLANAAPANETALRDWAAWTARRDADYHLGATRRAVLATVDGIVRTAAKRPLRVGARTVDEHVVPFVLFNGLDDDRDEAAGSLAADVSVLARAAGGAEVTPTPALRDTLDFVATAASSAVGGSQAAVLCGDRAVDRDPEVYWRRIERSRVHEPVMGPLLNDISPCAFWPVPRERPTTVHNDVPALIVASTGDTRTIYPGARALNRMMTGSRLLTLSGARIHAVYPRYDNACVNDAVNAYLRTGALRAAVCH
ncbi:alpha/beta fold hydrolase [Actinomadura sp. DC4]|uniref:alpha/beta fold hydrolase n=1 Tax=Actinomadura sp. DC4 TaxID=3055069 RepID=UPI0025B1AE23|nr:alpha/beta fold hydrolase [Actinomadura sp. DC4]MDN3357878.1 alpha/beta fold hydrolase [Actinomadura sp. DC4]